jgi:hypothetical protein
MYVSILPVDHFPAPASLAVFAPHVAESEGSKVKGQTFNFQFAIMIMPGSSENVYEMSRQIEN